MVQGHDLERLLDEARGEADRAFGNPAVFLEKYVPRACTSKSRFWVINTATCFTCTSAIARCNAVTKVVEIAPSVALDECAQRLWPAAVELAKHIRYDNAGVESLRHGFKKWYFIEMNPHPGGAHGHRSGDRHHLVRAQIQVAQGGKLHGDVMQLPKQKNVPCVGHAVQARVTTEILPTISRSITGASSPTVRRPVSACGSMEGRVMPAVSSRRSTIRYWSRLPPAA